MTKDFYKIYIDTRVLQLINTNDVPFVLLQHPSEKIYNYDTDPKCLLNAINTLEAGKSPRLIIHSKDLVKLFKSFTSYYQSIPASGGIILNEKSEILAIFRRKHWDFPKGKMEGKETKRQTAIREVKEECGLKKVTISTKLGVTYHTFGTKDKRKLKVSTWYVMHTNDQKLIPQKEEDIEKAVWFSEKDFMLKAKPVYANILDVFEAYLLAKPKITIPQNPKTKKIAV